MTSRRFAFAAHLSLTRQFMLVGLVILVAAALGLGRWVGEQIEQTVVHRTAETTALFVDSFIAPNLQELAASESISVAHMDTLGRLLEDTPLGRHIVAFKVWDAEGRVLYSAEPEAIGRSFPISDSLARAWQGQIVAGISELEDEENVLERAANSQLLEIYSPVREAGSDRIIAVAEFYQSVEDLQDDINVARRQSWLVVVLAMLVIYALLSGFVGRAGDTIDRQQVALSEQVTRLTELLAQNEALHDRVRRAAARTTALNERVLRRISAELHDGPVQELGLALLRLDHAVVDETVPAQGQADRDVVADLVVVRDSLQRAMVEIRSVSAGLGVPQLDRLTLPDTVRRAVRVHEQRSRTAVALDLDGAPDEASLAIKITVYRLVQEALHNAYRHAGGVGQRVDLRYEGQMLHVEVADSGPGMRADQSMSEEGRLGLIGMRERVESLGGSFTVASAPGGGTRVIAELKLGDTEDEDGR